MTDMRNDIVAKAETIVAQLPDRWDDMTAASSKLLATFLGELQGAAGAILAYQRMIRNTYAPPSSGMTLDQAINEGVIPEDAVIAVAESEAAWVQVTKAQMVIQAWQASSGHPGAFTDSPLEP